MTHPFLEIIDFIVNSSQTKNSMSNTRDTPAAQRQAVKLQLHVSGKSDENYSDANSRATKPVQIVDSPDII